MSALGFFVVAIIVMGVILLLGIFAVAGRRGDADGAPTAADLDPKAIKADRARAAVRSEAASSTAVATKKRTEVVEAEEHMAPLEPVPDPGLEREPITTTQYGVTRRKFFNRAILAVFGLFLVQFTIASLAFMWPKLKGGFGTPISVGNFEELKAEVIQGATVVPKFVAAAQTWIVPFEMSALAGSSYEDVPFVIAGGEGDGVGLMALWQRCVHLGCRVPDCLSSQGFECPCHGSKYNIHGEYEAGPAPRNLDRFGTLVNDAGDMIVETGTVVQTARSKTKTAPYPQGPFCV